MEQPSEKPTRSDKLMSLYVAGLMVVLVAALLLTAFVLYNVVYKPDWSVFYHQPAQSEAEKAAAWEAFQREQKLKKELATCWKPADIAEVKEPERKAQLLYGQELIAHTAKYLGPRGSVLQITNGMNCQNCHLEAGTKAFGNNYGSVAPTYPKYRARSGTVEDLYKRVNDCLERSLNGKPLPQDNREMQAIMAYINFVGSKVEKGKKAKGSGIVDLPFLDRALDPEKGKQIYMEKCQSCHGADGQGQLAEDGREYTYPPLWGKNSYNQGAGLYRMSRFAGYVKYNMPWGASYLNPQLTDEEAWDLAAFVNTQARPAKDVSKDWPKIAEKPLDHPFGPYADGFSEQAHKLGPFKPIAEARKK